MLDNIFIAVLNMSITASYAAIVIFLLRMLLKKAPKWIPYAMWSVVLLRAVFPFSFSSVLSLFGRLGGADAATANGTIRYIPESIGMVPCHHLPSMRRTETLRLGTSLEAA